MKRAVPVMEEDPPGSPSKAENPNRRSVMPVKSRGGKRLRKRPATAGQVCDEKTNVCEPLLTHRNNPTTASKPGSEVVPGTKTRPVPARPEPGGDLRVGLVVPGV
jgi:hypothetical protein